MRVLVLLLAGGLALPARAFDPTAAGRVLDVSHQKLTATTTRLTNVTLSPKATRSDGTWSTVANTNLFGWTQGFLPGLLWQMYGATGDPAWRARAEEWTKPLEVQKTNGETHDLGFKMFPSFVSAWKATGNPAYRDVALTAARTLATRWRPNPGIVECCDWNASWQLPLVVDTMMNLELLLWGAQNGGDPAWTQLALGHARVTGRDLVRADGSTFHVVDYVPATGAVRFKGTYQGYSNASTWSRGQAWAIYGYTMVYRYTRDPEMLALARKTAGYWLSRTPADGVPNWDFDAPTVKKDSSAAAAVASAFLELAGFVADPAEAARYRDAALRALDTLSSPAYLATSATPSILLHGVGHLPANQEVDVGLVYGDHYFLEAVLRHTPRPPMRWESRLSFTTSLRELGRGNYGIRTMEFDVTPRTAPTDGVVGYADRSNAVTSYSSFAMLVRLNPSGFFDVRNGGSYAALVRVPYQAGATYHVRVVADMGAKRYSVWVRPPGGAEVRIASGYAFRSDAPFSDDVGRIGLRTARTDGDYSVANHRMASGSAPIPAALELSDVVLGPDGQPAGGCGTAEGAGGKGALAMLAASLAILLLARRRRAAA